MSKYEYLLFDLDGTLTDSAEGITNSVAYALEKFGIAIKDKSVLCPFIGPPLPQAFGKYYGFSKSDALRATEYFREYFREKGIYENKVYEEIPSFLKNLCDNKFHLAVATSKPEPFARKILSRFSIDKYFEVIAGATFDGKIATKTQVIEYAYGLLNTNDKSKLVMIGDRNHDILGAKEFNIDSIGVLYGYGSYEELMAAGATCVAKSVSDLERIILQ